MIRIKQLTGQESQEIFNTGVQLIQKTQGTKSVAQNHVHDYATGQLSCAFGAFDEDRLIGVATAVIRPEKEFSLYTESMGDQLALQTSSEIGLLRSMSVSPSYQGRGIGKKLVLERLKWMKDNGIRRAWVMSWMNGQKHNSANVYRAIGFECIRVIPNFFQTQDCLVCAGSCTCSIGIFVMDLDPLAMNLK